MGSLCISPDELVSEAGVVTEGDFEALCRMEITFKRKKGEYFACYDFGTAITPDSDQMVRIGTLAMIRLMLRCGAFRACYGKLDVDAPARAAAVRAKVADPFGFSPGSRLTTRATGRSRSWSRHAVRTAGCSTRLHWIRS